MTNRLEYSIMARKTIQEFVEQAQQVHGDKFDYSGVEYFNTHTPVKIRCNQCGLVFFQEPSSHLAGRGCPKCSKKQTHKRVNQDMFLARAKEVHGDKYDYSNTDYQNMRSKVAIICPRLGVFYQRAQSHILGCGCPECKRENHLARIKLLMESLNMKGQDLQGDNSEQNC